jgi:hypothetical protein
MTSSPDRSFNPFIKRPVSSSESLAPTNIHQKGAITESTDKMSPGGPPARDSSFNPFTKPPVGNLQSLSPKDLRQNQVTTPEALEKIQARESVSGDSSGAFNPFIKRPVSSPESLAPTNIHQKGAITESTDKMSPGGPPARDSSFNPFTKPPVGNLQSLSPKDLRQNQVTTPEASEKIPARESVSGDSSGASFNPFIKTVRKVDTLVHLPHNGGGIETNEQTITRGSRAGDSSGTSSNPSIQTSGSEVVSVPPNDLPQTRVTSETPEKAARRGSPSSWLLDESDDNQPKGSRDEKNKTLVPLANFLPKPGDKKDERPDYSYLDIDRAIVKGSEVTQEAKELIFTIPYPLKFLGLPYLTNGYKWVSGRFGNFFWHQDEDRIFAFYPLSNSLSPLKKSDISIILDSVTISISIKGELILAFPTFEKFIPDNTFWTIEKDYFGHSYLFFDITKKFRFCIFESLFPRNIKDKSWRESKQPSGNDCY